MADIGGNRRYRMKNLGTMEDIRQPRGYTTSETAEDVMNSMLNIILNHKKEIQKLPHFSSVASSQNWIQRHPSSGLRVQEKDLNGDNRPEVVVYNKAGRPFIVNGYKLRASDYPQRRMYWGTHPDHEDRIGEPYGAWVQGKLYKIKEDPDFAWGRKVKLSKEGEQLKAWGYRMPTAPRAQTTPYAIFCKLIKPIVDEYLNGDFKPELGEAVGDENVKFIKKIISPISMYRMLFMKLVERDYYFFLRSSGDVQSYDYYKVYKKNHKVAFFDWFVKNYLTGERKAELRRDTLPFAVIKGAFVKGDFNFDGSDPDDSLLFMMSFDNINDEETHPLHQSEDPTIANWKFEDFVVNNAAAAELNKVLADKKHPAYKEAKKAMNKFQKRAQASTKQYFKDMVEYVFENQQQYDQWLQNLQQGAPSAAQNDAIAQEANQELQDNNVAMGSPVRPPSNEPDNPTVDGVPPAEVEPEEDEQEA